MINFQCTLKHNLKYGQIMKELTAFSEMPEHEASDMCIVAILSHGDDGLIFSSGISNSTLKSLLYLAPLIRANMPLHGGSCGRIVGFSWVD